VTTVEPQPEVLAIPLPEVRPMLRGALHAGMAAAAPFVLLTMLLIADSPRAYVGAAILGASLCALYTTSASYHLGPWRGWARGLMKRLDHAMIFALIAGTYTPFCLIVLGNAWGISLLSVVWSLAGAGMLLTIAWPHAPRWLGVSLYVALGWIALVAAWEIPQHLTSTELSLLVLGGLLYTAGGIVYALRRPNPSPRYFGFHEVFHALVIAGSLVHVALIAIYILPS
jgi:hemolysin III